jgi:hypothetical protein
MPIPRITSIIGLTLAAVSILTADTRADLIGQGTALGPLEIVPGVLQVNNEGLRFVASGRADILIPFTCISGVQSNAQKAIAKRDWTKIAFACWLQP